MTFRIKATRAEKPMPYLRYTLEVFQREEGLSGFWEELKRYATEKEAEEAYDWQVQQKGRHSIHVRIVDEGAEITQEELRDMVAEHAKGHYWCERVWHAWSCGTMGEDDFHPSEETELPNDLALAVFNRLKGGK